MKMGADAKTTTDTGAYPTQDLSLLSRWPSEEARAWVLDFATRACAAEQTQALIIIGSIVRPVATVNDVDVIYVYEKQPLPYRRHPLDVDVRAFTGSEITLRFQEKNDLAIWALEFGFLLCERGAFWSTLRNRYKRRSVLPSPQTALERSERAARRLDELNELGDLEAASEQLVSALTHRAWYQLLTAEVLPASRSELPSQLRAIGQERLAAELEQALEVRQSGKEIHLFR